MAYQILFSKKAKDGLLRHQRSGNIRLLNKIRHLIDELKEHPRTGTGQVERLKYMDYPDTWSRRINHEHRLVYEIHEDQIVVTVISTFSHYGDI